MPDVPDLAATLPERPPTPDRDLVSSWSAESMDGHLLAQDKLAAWGSAWLAAARQAQGCPHLSVMLALAGAETKAPAADRPFHAARLDAYAAAYGLSGWYRGTDRHGKHFVQVNRLRTAAEGNTGRWYVHALSDVVRREDGARFLVVDRDTGRTSFQSCDQESAVAWIKDNGGAE